MMKYLLCYTYHNDDDNYDPDDDFFGVESETYTDFAEAIEQYTLKCGNSHDVVLADLEKKTIIRQCSRDGDAICIF